MDAKKPECRNPAAGSADEKLSISIQRNGIAADDTKETSKIIEDHSDARENKIPVDSGTEDQIPHHHVESGLSNAEISMNPDNTIKAARDAANIVRNAILYSQKHVVESLAALNLCSKCSEFAAWNKSTAANDQIMNHYRSMGDQWLKINNDIREAAFRAEEAVHEGLQSVQQADECVRQLAEALKMKPDTVAEAERCVIEATNREKTAADEIYKKQYKLLVAVKTCWECVSYKAICYPELPGERICECSFGRWIWLIAVCCFVTLGSVMICLPSFVILNSTAYNAVIDVGITLVILSTVIGLSRLFEPRCNRIDFMHKRGKKLAMCKKHLQDLAIYAPESQADAESNQRLSEENELPQDCNEQQPLL